MIDPLEILAEKPVNTQLYENSSLAGSAIETAAKENPLAFYNQKLPNFAIIHEKPEHRMAIYLKARGKSNRAIARQMGYTEPWMSQIVRQPWFQQRLLEELRAEGEDGKAFMKTQVEMSLLTLCTLRDTSQSDPVRAQCCNSILDRYLGKPVQRVKDESKPLSAQEREMQSIEAELEELEAEEKQLLGVGEGGSGSESPEMAPVEAPPAAIPLSDAPRPDFNGPKKPTVTELQLV